MSKLFWLKQNGSISPITWDEKNAMLRAHPKRRFIIAWVGGKTVGLRTEWHNGQYFEVGSVWVRAKVLEDLIESCYVEGSLKRD